MELAYNLIKDVSGEKVMDNSLMISNVYAAYTAAADKSDKNVSELSKMVKGGEVSAKEEKEDSPELNMDKVIISREALDRLNGMNLNAVK